MIHKTTSAQDLAERKARVLDANVPPKESRHPLMEYDGDTLTQKVQKKSIEEERRLRTTFLKIKSPTEGDLLHYQNQVSRHEEDTVIQMCLANRHDKNEVWQGRFRKAGVWACLGTMISLYGCLVAMVATPEKSAKRQLAGLACVATLAASWGCTLEMNRLERANRKIRNHLNSWDTLKPTEKYRFSQKVFAPEHMGLSGFFETFTQRG